MVSYKDVINNNQSLKTAGSGLTAVFLGATNGIGLGALRALTAHTSSPTIYVVGRSASRLDSITAELRAVNGTARLIPVVAHDLTLVRDAQQAAIEIAKSADKIDLLVMSPGYIAYSYDESPEGLERCQSIRYYARTRFLLTLLPLLRKAPSPRVVGVLAGGLEGSIWPDDWHLKSHFGIMNAAGAASGMTTLMYEQLSQKPENDRVVFIHLYPGGVGGTGLTVSGLGPVASFLISWLVWAVFGLFGYTAAEAGERVLFAATSGRFRKLDNAARGDGTLVQKGSDGLVGSGVYLVKANGEVTPGNKVLDTLRKDGVAEKVYEHTMDEFERIAKM